MRAADTQIAADCRSARLRCQHQAAAKAQTVGIDRGGDRMVGAGAAEGNDLTGPFLAGLGQQQLEFAHLVAAVDSSAQAVMFDPERAAGSHTWQVYHAYRCGEIPQGRNRQCVLQCGVVTEQCVHGWADYSVRFFLFFRRASSCWQCSCNCWYFWASSRRWRFSWRRRAMSSVSRPSTSL